MHYSFVETHPITKYPILPELYLKKVPHCFIPTPTDVSTPKKPTSRYTRKYICLVVTDQSYHWLDNCKYLILHHLPTTQQQTIRAKHQTNRILQPSLGRLLAIVLPHISSCNDQFSSRLLLRTPYLPRSHSQHVSQQPFLAMDLLKFYPSWQRG